MVIIYELNKVHVHFLEANDGQISEAPLQGRSIHAYPEYVNKGKGTPAD